jgi:hypothetical protein
VFVMVNWRSVMICWCGDVFPAAALNSRFVNCISIFPIFFFPPMRILICLHGGAWWEWVVRRKKEIEKCCRAGVGGLLLSEVALVNSGSVLQLLISFAWKSDQDCIANQDL